MKNNFIKLFEIPVYGLSEQTLKKRVSAKEEKIISECQVNGSSQEHGQTLARHCTSPMRNWDYNHIVGYIKIYADGQDMNFTVFLPYDKRDGHLPKYSWWSGRKFFIQDSGASGLHFYLGNMKSNEEIQQRTSEMLHGIIKEHIPKRYFTDTRAFDAINAHIDYLALVKQCTPPA